MTPTLEGLFRYALHHDFGTSPEDILRRMGVTDKSSWHYHMSLTTMLREFEAHIRAEGVKQNIDARAIAGAIAWEYEENLRGRYSDYLPNWVNDGAGWGSMHTEPARGLRPAASDGELYRLRMNASSAITLVAEFMNKMAKLYFDLTEGVWINDAPSVLATFYNTGEGLLQNSAARHKQNSCQVDAVEELVVSQNPMGRWVHQNLARFQNFQTTPTPPVNAHFVRVKAN